LVISTGFTYSHIVEPAFMATIRGAAAENTGLRARLERIEKSLGAGGK
jgi:hypothetical protein